MANTRKFESPIKVRFPADQTAQLERLSEEHGITVTALVRACVKAGLPIVERAIKRTQGHG